jgi:hypothetical protein
MSDYRFDEHPGKDPDETLLVSLDLFDMCANFWAPNEQFGTGEYVRPNKATGFSYECTTAGTSAAREPVWPTTISATKVDGSITWTCRAASSNGVNAVSSPSATSEPTGLTIGSVAASESTKINATYSGGVDGESYDAVFTFTLNGVTRIARQKVPVRKL